MVSLLFQKLEELLLLRLAEAGVWAWAVLSAVALSVPIGRRGSPVARKCSPSGRRRPRAWLPARYLNQNDAEENGKCLVRFSNYLELFK